MSASPTTQRLEVLVQAAKEFACPSHRDQKIVAFHQEEVSFVCLKCLQDSKRTFEPVFLNGPQDAFDIVRQIMQADDDSSRGSSSDGWSQNTLGDFPQLAQKFDQIVESSPAKFAKSIKKEKRRQELESLLEFTPKQHSQFYDSLEKKKLQEIECLNQLFDDISRELKRKRLDGINQIEQNIRDISAHLEDALESEESPRYASIFEKPTNGAMSFETVDSSDSGMMQLKTSWVVRDTLQSINEMVFVRKGDSITKTQGSVTKKISEETKQTVTTEESLATRPKGAITEEESKHGGPNQSKSLLGTMTEDDIEFIGQLFRVSREESIDLSDKKLSSRAIKPLALVLQSNPSVVNLALDNNNIGDDGLTIVLDSLKDSAKLESLSLAKNNLTDDSANVLTDFIINQNPNIKEINLSSNRIGDTGAKKLIDILISNTVVPVLRVDGLKLKKYNKIGEVFQKYNTRIQGKETNARTVYFQKGYALESLLCFRKAVELYRKAIELDSKDPLPRLNQGCAFHSMGKLSEAIKCYEIVLHLDPKNFKAHKNRGLAYHELKCLPEALDSFNKALAVDRSYAMAHFNKGQVLRDMERFHAALVAFDEAITLKSDYAPVHYQKGKTYFTMNDYEKAIACYDQALKLDPKVKKYEEARSEAIAARDGDELYPERKYLEDQL